LLLLLLLLPLIVWLSSDEHFLGMLELALNKHPLYLLLSVSKLKN
jgi:hypothetical protein